MKILIVEDDPAMLDELLREVKRSHPALIVESYHTEHAFRSAFASIVANPPALAIIDMILPWTEPAPRMPQTPADVRRDGPMLAGWRCQAMFTGHPNTARVPVIVYTSLPRADLDPDFLQTKPSHVLVVGKDEPAKLWLLLRNLLPVSKLDPRPATSVFVVHGHDLYARDSVVRFLKHRGVRAVVLSSEAKGMSTIIEAFEENANVAYAIALLSPDDVGEARSRRRKPLPRARQNVIFELGYFVARLGRKKVCALCTNKVEIPSDVLGMAYITFDKEGAWRATLEREMKAAGLFV